MSSAIETLVFHNAATHRALRALLARCREQAWAATPHRALGRAARLALVHLKAHHGFEDEILLPRIRDARVDGPWEALAADHARLAEAIDGLEATRPGEAAFVGALERLIAELDAHAAREEAALTEAFYRTWLTEEEARGLGRSIMAHQRERLKPTATLLPVLLYNLDEADRARFTEKMPRFVKDALVPVLFRPAWRGLRPFLAHPPRRWLPRIRIGRGDGVKPR